MLPIDADPAERDFVKLLERALAPSFTLVRRLGAGGMGSVYLARDPVLKRLVAVKVMAPALAADAEARARFEREAQAVAAITHPSVVSVYSVGELENGVPYLVMQYVEGRTMADRVAEGGPLDAPTARRVLGEVASALAAAHRHGIVHRDIKPANILWDEETERALVSDFGIAAVKPRPEESADEKLTQTGASVGTPAYMSPEQVLAEPVTERTDVYALGLLGYELLTGAGPYAASSPRELMAAHLRDTPKKLSSMRGDVDAELERLLEECLAKDPARRPTAAEVEGRLTHGATILLEWPPPGLESLRGKFAGALRFTALGAALVAVPLAGLSAFDRDSLVRQIIPPLEFVFSFATLGMLLFLGGCVAVMQYFRAAVRAVDTGYRWGTICEVAADRRGDTGALITGAREYATLSPAQRSRFRLARVVTAVLQLAASLIPVVGYGMGVVLGARFAHGPSIVLWSSLYLAIALALVSAGLIAWEDRVLRAARGRRLALSSVRERPTELAAQWTETFDQVREGQRLGPGIAGHRREVLRTVIATLVVAAITAIVGNALILLTTVTSLIGGRSAPVFAVTQDRVDRVGRLRAYVVPSDVTVLPLRAGQALHSVSRAGGIPAANQWEAAPAIRIAGYTPPDAKPPFPDSSLVEAFQVAPRGFSDEQRRYLLRLGDNPSLAEFRLVANAPRLDLSGAMWNVPVGTPLLWMSLPMPNFAGMRNAARSNIARAALDLAAGQRSDAERRLREVISVGFLMIRDGHTIIENMMGASMVDEARLALEAFLQVTGRPAEARLVSRASDAEARIETSRESLRFSDVLETLRRAALDTTRLTGLRWEMALNYGVAPCTDLRQIVFGVDSAHVAFVRDVERGLVHTRADSMLLSIIEQPLDDRRMVENGRPLVATPRSVLGWLGNVLTGHHVFSACAAIVDAASQ